MVPFIFIHFVTRTFFLPLSDNSVNQILPSVDNVPWATLVMAFLALLPPARDCYTYFTCYTYLINSLRKLLSYHARCQMSWISHYYVGHFLFQLQYHG